MNKLDEQRKIELKLFLTELEKLTVKYKFAVDGSDVVYDLVDNARNMKGNLNYKIHNNTYAMQDYLTGVIL